MDGIIHGLLLLFARFPKLGGLVGLVIALAFGNLGIASWNAVQKMPQSPFLTTLDQAAASVTPEADAWVEIEKVNWDCQNIIANKVGSDLRTEAVFTNENGALLGVAVFSGSKKLSCAELPEAHVAGLLSAMADGFYKKMPDRGFNLGAYPDGGIRLNLCMFCGRGNSLGLVFISLILAPIGLAMYPLCLKMRKHYQEIGIL